MGQVDYRKSLSILEKNLESGPQVVDVVVLQQAFALAMLKNSRQHS